MKAMNKEYWKNKKVNMEKAERHLREIESKFQKEINQCIAETVIYEDDISMDEQIQVVDMDSVSAIFKYHVGKTAVLNFASYKEPGGLFLKGSSAQEESLCHESILYPVLKSFKDSYYEVNKKI